jgi:excisionase family DNA binding protein
MMSTGMIRPDMRTAERVVSPPPNGWSCAWSHTYRRIPDAHWDPDGKWPADELEDDMPTAPEPLLTPAEVAALFRVDPKTVTRWAKAGKLTAIRTLGGHRRYREAEVRAVLAGVPTQRTESD